MPLFSQSLLLEESNVGIKLMGFVLVAGQECFLGQFG